MTSTKLKETINYYELYKRLDEKIDMMALDTNYAINQKLEKILDFIILTNIELLQIKLPKLNFPEHGEYQKSNKKIVYIDSNIYMDIENDLKKEKHELQDSILNSKMHFEYCYSPSHLEDILKRDLSGEAIDGIKEVLKNITGDLFIHRKDLGIIYNYEEFASSYARTNPEYSIRITELAEQQRLLQREKYILLYPEYSKEEHKISINNKELFGKNIDILEKALWQIGATIYLEEIKDININAVIYENLHSIIYNLWQAMDVLRFWSDKEEEKIRSGTHDIEHLIYAAYADIFVSNDKRLINRAKAIFGHIRPTLQVKTTTEFLKYISEKDNDDLP